MNIVRHLSRCIRYVDADNNLQIHHLSIAELTLDDCNRITAVDIRPFARESHSVVYHDSPLEIRELPDGTFSFVETA